MPAPKAAFILVLALSSLPLCGCPSSSAPIPRISSKITRPWSGYINPHVEDTKTLTVDGVEYTSVQGTGELHIAVKDAPFIVFVTSNPDYSSTIHLYNLDTKRDTPFRVKHGTVGFYIGSDRRYSRVRDDAEFAADGTFVLTNTRTTSSPPGYTLSRYILDPVTGNQIKLLEIWQDRHRKTTREYVSLPPF